MNLSPLLVTEFTKLSARSLPLTNPPRDIVLYLKDFLIKEEILRAARNSRSITLNGTMCKIYPDLPPATLDRRRKMKEVTTVLAKAHTRHRWGFPFKTFGPP